MSWSRPGSVSAPIYPPLSWRGGTGIGGRRPQLHGHGGPEGPSGRRGEADARELGAQAGGDLRSPAAAGRRHGGLSIAAEGELQGDRASEGGVGARDARGAVSARPLAGTQLRGGGPRVGVSGPGRDGEVDQPAGPAGGGGAS